MIYLPALLLMLAIELALCVPLLRDYMRAVGQPGVRASRAMRSGGTSPTKQGPSDADLR